MAKTLVLLRKSATLGDMIKQEVALAKHTNRVRPCPHCGSTETGIMPPDFETAKCADCGRLFPPHAVDKAVEHQAAGTTTTNPDTGKVIHGGQFTVSHGGGSFDIAQLTTWSAPKRVMAQGVPKDLSTGPQPANWWDLWGNPTVKDQLRAAGVSPGKDQNGRWVLNWWRTPSEADQKAARKEVAGANKRMEMSSALDSKLVVPKGPNVPSDQDYFDFQRAGIDYAKDLDAALIADEMGLGKTLQAIGVANLDKKCRKVLVVVPASLRPNWRKEWRKWGSNGLTVGTFDTGAAHLPSTDVVIINYDNLAKMRGEIDKRKWDMLVVDEVHFAKGDPKDVQRSAALWGGTNATLGTLTPIEAKRKLYLTGTPILNRPKELWNLVHSLDPEGLGKNFFKFALRYCDGKQVSIGRGRLAWDFDGHSNLDELQQKLRSKFMRRVLKKDAWVNQPVKMRQLVPIEPGAEAKKVLSRMAEDFANTKAGQAKAKMDALEAEGKQNTAAYARAVDQLMESSAPAFESLSRDRRDLAIAKVDDVASFAKDMLESQDKIIIFAHHVEVVDKLMAALKKYNPVKVVGGMTDTQKDHSVVSFQENPNTRVFIGNIKAAGVGYTLTASDTLVFAEQDWSPGTMQQAEDRCILEGQKVLTPTGWVPIDEIGVGDAVIGGDGLPHVVKDTWSRRAKGAYARDSKLITEIEVMGYYDLIKVTSDHRVLTTDGWMDAGLLQPGTEICMPGAYDGATLDGLEFPIACRVAESFTTPNIEARVGSGRPKPESVQINGRLFVAPKVIETSEDSMFVYGYYIGDGFASTAGGKGRFVSFCGHRNQKATHLARCAGWATRMGATGTTYDHKQYLCSELRVWSAELAYWFESQFGAKLKEKHIPEWVFASDISQRKAFLDGMMASDGYVRRNRHEYVTASYRLCADATRLMTSIGLKPCVTVGWHGNHYVVAYTSGSINHGLKVQSVRTRYANKTERVYDITVEDAETFVVGTAVVHNCHRIGQVSPFVNYYTLVYDDSIDSYMAKMVQRKAGVIKRAVDRSPGDAVKPLAMPAKQVAAPTTVVLAPSLAVDKPKPTAAPSGAGAGESSAPAPTPVTVKVVTPKFSPGQIAELRRHIDTLMRNSPDGASTRNDVGFSGATLEPGRDLAYNSNWSTRDAEMAARIVRNHSKQVGAEWDEHGRIMAPDMPPWEENSAPGSGAASSAYLGKVRERHAMNNLTLQSMRPIYGDYGTSYVYTFKDKDGHLVEAKVSNPIGNAHHDGDLKDGETVNLEGFVTEHGSQWRTNIPVTRVNRVKVSATPFLPSTPKPAKKVAIRKGIDLTPEMQRVIESRDSICADPSDAQKEAGNYRMGHVRIHGLDISIETPKGGTRSGVGPDGKPWSVAMKHDYGYIRSVD